VAKAKSMILCDTNILIEFYKNTPYILQEFRHIGYTQLAISVITQAELYFGALNKAELHKIKRHLSLLTSFPVTKTISTKFLELMEAYCLSHKLSLPDAIIAATAMTHKIELYTFDRKDFQYIPEIRFYKPATYL
jgi:predicted nucleic acid-binding protein